MSDCTHDCGSCGSNCGERMAPGKKPANEMSNIKKVIGIVSGKGGVGKSLVTSMLACLANKKGYKTAVLDADITGPSIPKMFGLNERAGATELGLLPSETKTGIDVMSLNLILEEETQPVIWRGAIISNVVEQFWTEVLWGDVDFMFVDMPPGTGDVPLTVFQSLPVDGIVIVASPQELVKMIVEKAVNMAKLMEVPVMGLVENMSYLKCPDCGKEIKIFGESHVEEISKEYNIPLIGRIPIDPQIAALCDKGAVEDMEGNYLEGFIPVLEELYNKKDEPVKFRIAVPYADGEINQHFGHCDQFKIYTFEGETLAASEVMDNPGGGHNGVVEFLSGQSVNAVICGGIGSGAREALDMAGIFLFGGVSGSCDEAVDNWSKGTLDYQPDIACTHHDHDGHCGGDCGGGCSGGCCH